VKKYFSPQEVARLVGISDARVRYWTRLGLVPCRRRPRRRLRYDFQGLVALRTIKDLRHQGVSLRHLRTCVEKLKKRHPDITAPLAQVRFAATRRRIIAVARQQRWFTPEGQLHLDFPREAGRVIPLPGADPGALFFQALDCERQGAWEEAREKYAAILAVRPDHPDALVNLGNILYRWRFPEGAEMHYRRALEADPEHVEANFNLPASTWPGPSRSGATLTWPGNTGSDTWPWTLRGSGLSICGSAWKESLKGINQEAEP